ncbi:methylthioribulose 1-phosphate dehydratase [Roseomonas nepalensis]|uniref:Methylthioribulose-1-phosphate dehydratase n=1 Tax=Muricoccus nepalensis TaxID=1854500 RepID=A0A502F7Z7_9PROT|nr:methylthioribulose 1-phosphate dehydratase [Roseomonas nepalensis]TPG45496.1 methylthioribulose 1-phosphate dehydratase [Roseomonas nepalensis]
MPDAIPEAAVAAVIEAGRRMAERNWVPATAGNISVRLPGNRVAITRSGFHKAHLTADAVMAVDLQGVPEDGALRPSAETGLHCGVYRAFPAARAVVHGHSVANTVLSRRAGETIRLEGYELLKAFPGLDTHAAAVAVPVLDNDQDITRLQAAVEARWARMADPVVPGYLIRGHGVYVWGPDMDAALARLEGLEFMLACKMAAISLGGSDP